MKKESVPASDHVLQLHFKNFRLNPKKCTVFLDGGLRAPAEYTQQQTVIKGDQKHKIISLASVVAKVSRGSVYDTSTYKISVVSLGAKQRLWYKGASPVALKTRIFTTPSKNISHKNRLKKFYTRQRSTMIPSAMRYHPNHE